MTIPTTRGARRSSDGSGMQLTIDWSMDQDCHSDPRASRLGLVPKASLLEAFMRITTEGMTMPELRQRVSWQLYRYNDRNTTFEMASGKGSHRRRQDRVGAGQQRARACRRALWNRKVGNHLRVAYPSRSDPSHAARPGWCCCFHQTVKSERRRATVLA